MAEIKRDIKPYVSKRKLKKDKQSEPIVSKKPYVDGEKQLQNLFLTNEIVWRYSKAKQSNYFPKQIKSSVPVASSPLWSLKWSKKYGHLLACTSESTLNLYDAFKEDVICLVYDSRHHDRCIRDLDWSRSNRQIVSCSFDKTLKVIDLMNGGVVSVSIELPKLPTVIRWSTEDDNLVVVGGHDSFLALYDLRTTKKAVEYKSLCGNVLALEFFPGCDKFIAAGDAVSRESPEHGLIVWDTNTGAKLSNQIFHERYSCPRLCIHPSGATFLAQTNGNYIARFSAHDRYKMDKCMRYERHRVGGYPVGFDLSPDGAIVASGSSDGSLVCYKYSNGSFLNSISLPEVSSSSKAISSPVIGVQWHPILPSTIAISDWSGRLHIVE